MRSGIVLLFVAALCCCTSCATYYYRTGTTFQQARTDCADCMAELEKRTTTTDTAGDYAHRFMEDCMKRKGYDLVTQDKLPLSVKREDPDTSMRGFLYGKRRGLAGTVE